MVDLSKEIKIDVKASIPQNARMAFKKDIEKIEQREYGKLREASCMIIQLFIQIGKPENQDMSALEYRNKKEIYLYVQPKIKTYMIFKSEESCFAYKNENLDDKDLYIICKIENGKIVNSL